jgi:hypothetical protein
MQNRIAITCDETPDLAIAKIFRAGGPHIARMTVKDSEQSPNYCVAARPKCSCERERVVA